VGSPGWGNVEGAIFERAKSELAYATFLKIRDTADPALQAAFLHHSNLIMDAVDTTPGTLFATALSDAFKQDAKAFPTNLQTYFKDSKVEADSQLRLFVLLFQAVIPGDGTDPLEMIGRLAAISPTPEQVATFAKLGADEKVMFVVGLLAEIVRFRRDTDASNWKKVTDEHLLNISRALTKKYMPDAKFEDKDFTTLFASINTVSTAVKGVHHPMQKQDAQAINMALDDVFASFQTLASKLIPVSMDPKAKAALERRITGTKDVIELLISAYSAYIDEKYDVVVADISLVANRVEDMTGADASHRLAISNFLKWAAVGAGLAKANNQGDFNQIIDSVSDPISSYRHYRSAGSMYLNAKAYLGVSKGTERIGGEHTNYGSAFVPIGVEFGWTTPWKGLSYIGAMASPLDVGAFTATRFGSKSETKSPAFQDIVAPGFYLTIGLSKNWPLTIGGGYQYAPHRAVDSVGKSVPANRIMFFMAIDVPYLGKVF
jgi:hypothetical protein